MGTRNLVMVISGGSHRIAQYGQWDGYPTGQGVTALAAISKIIEDGALDAFKAKLLGCRFLPQSEILELWKEQGADDSGFVSMEIAEKFGRAHPQLSRDTGAEVINLVNHSESGLPLRDSYDFAGDGLFCEWAYVIDLDGGTFEVYKGFGKETLTPADRFHDLSSFIAGDYQPVKICHSWPLDKLPSSQEFIEALEPSSEDCAENA